MNKGKVYACTCGCGMEVKVVKAGKDCDCGCELRCCEAPMVLKKT